MSNDLFVRQIIYYTYIKISKFLTSLDISHEDVLSSLESKAALQLFRTDYSCIDMQPKPPYEESVPETNCLLTSGWYKMSKEVINLFKKTDKHFIVL